jgi:hypothetical protein
MLLVSWLRTDAEAAWSLRPTPRKPRPPRDRVNRDDSVCDVVPAIPNALGATHVLASRFMEAAQWLIVAA